MKGKIDKDGYPYIERAGKMKRQDCANRPVYCGDWCPLFGEPERVPNTVEMMSIDLCKVTLNFTDFTDERVSP